MNEQLNNRNCVAIEACNVELECLLDALHFLANYLLPFSWIDDDLSHYHFEEALYELPFNWLLCWLSLHFIVLLLDFSYSSSV